MKTIEKVNQILKKTNISKVNLAKYLGVSRQMVYNYLDCDSLDKWPKDKKVLLLNLLGIKSVDEIENIKVDTDYIMDVETRINNLFENSTTSSINDGNSLLNGMGKNQKELLKKLDIKSEEALKFNKKIQNEFIDTIFDFVFIITFNSFI